MKVSNLLLVVLLLLASCSGNNKGITEESGNSYAGMIPVGTGMITEIYLHPDTTGDPWEVEKVAGYGGEEMFLRMTEKIYSGKLKIYDCITAEELSGDDIRKLESEYGPLSKITGKMIFTEDWFYNPITGSIEKKIKTIAFGYEQKREGGLPSAWKPLFMIKNE